MIELTALNGRLLVINPVQVECIQEIPDTKIVMMNGKYHIVRETPHEVAMKAADFYRSIRTLILCIGPAEPEAGEEEKQKEE